MKVQYLSDIHLEFYIENPWSNFIITGDVLAIAGDLAVGAPAVISALKSLNEQNPEKPIIYVPGNHEFYSGKNIPVAMTVEQIKKELEDIKNVHVLYRNIVTLNDVNFFGCVGWPDGSAGSINSYKFRVYNDFHQIANFAEDYKEWGTMDKIFLESALRKHKGLKNVVITHFLPTFELISGRFKGDFLNPCFANEWLDWISMMDIQYWIYGHSHANIEKTVGKVNFKSNQAGYVFEINKEYDRQKYFEI